MNLRILSLNAFKLLENSKTVLNKFDNYLINLMFFKKFILGFKTLDLFYMCILRKDRERYSEKLE